MSPPPPVATGVSRGMDRSATVWSFASRWAMMMVSVRVPSSSVPQMRML